MTIELDEEATKRLAEAMKNPKPMDKEVIDRFKRVNDKIEKENSKGTKK